MKKLLRVLLCLLIALVLVAGGYVAYVFISYSRIPDMQSLEVSSGAAGMLPAGQEVSIVTWNLGFGAYSSDYSFFMDGGTESRAYSKEAVNENIGAAIDALTGLSPDLMILQEVDFDSTRSYHVDERAMIVSAFPQHDSVFAQNYNSPYLFYPLTKPHGASKSGILTLSTFPVADGLRRSLPVENGFRKILDLDRCYSVSRIPTEDGRELCLYNLHLSAYTSDGSISAEQLRLILTDMAGEYEAGNYVIAGGDFNKDLSGRAGEIFGVSGEDYSWAKPLDSGMIPEGFQLADAIPENGAVPSCRNCDIPYIPGETFVLTVDGFIVSDNVRIADVHVIDEGFAHSDHNPVMMRFTLGDGAN